MINARASNGQTALHFACRENYAELARVLVRGGADVNCADEVGRTPISYAFRHPYDSQTEGGGGRGGEEEEQEEEEEEEAHMAGRRTYVSDLPRSSEEEEEEDEKPPDGCLDEILTRSDVQVIYHCGYLP